jgi:6-phosphofructokinase 2
MIHTLTLGPSLDLTYHVQDFSTDDNNRATQMHRSPGGKGINVSRVATRLDHPTVALGFIGGTTGMEVEALLQAEGVQTWFIPVPGTTRTNPIIQNEAGAQLRVIAPVPTVSEQAGVQLWDAVFALRPPDFLLIGGSLPKDVSADFFRRVLARAQQAGVRVVVDADGDELRELVQAGADLIKPNRYELERLLGRTFTTLDEVVVGGQDTLRLGAGAVAISLGAEGALLIRPDGVWRAVPPAVEVISPVGSGDSLLAGLCVKLAEGWAPQDALSFGVACGSATAMTPGTGLCTREQAEALRPQVVSERLAG